MTLGEMIIRVGADTKAFALGMGDVNKQLGAVEREASRSFGSIEKMGARLSSVGMGLTAAVTLPVVGLGAASLTAAAKMETASTAFRTMMGSVAAANKHLADLRAFALSTPFEFTELVDASRKMQALGFAASDVIPKLRSIGNAVSALGLGAEGLNRVILALGQMKAKGTVQAEEMRQLAEAGIPAWDALAKKLGVDVATAMKMVEQRTVSAKTGIEAIEQAMGRFAGGMEAQAKTLGGIWSNVKDAIGFALADIGKTLAPTAKDVLNNVLLPSLDVAKGMAQAFSELPGPVKNTTIALAGLAAVAGPLLFGLGQIASSISTLILAFKSLSLGAASLSTALRALPFVAVAAGTAYLLDKLVQHRQVTEDTSENAMRKLNARLREQSELASGVAANSLGDLAKSVFAVGAESEKTTPKVEGAEHAVEKLKLTTMGLADTLRAIEESQAYSKMEQDLFKVMDAARGVPGLIPTPDRDLTRPEEEPRRPEDILRTPTNLPELRAEDRVLINIEAHAEEIAKTQERLGMVIKTKTAPAMSQFGRQVSTIFTDAGSRIADLIVRGGKLKDIFVGVAQQIETAFLRMVIEGAIRQAIKWVGKLMDALGGLGGALGRIFGSIGGALGGGAGSAVGSIARGVGGAAGAAGSAAGSASSAVGGTVMGVVGAVGSVVSAVSGIIGNFQQSETNTTLDRIVLHTLQTANDLANLRRDDWERETHLMHKLDDMWRTVLEFKDGMFRRMDTGTGKLTGNAVTVSINGGYFLSSSAMDDFIDNFVARLKQRGIL